MGWGPSVACLSDAAPPLLLFLLPFAGTNSEAVSWPSLILLVSQINFRHMMSLWRSPSSHGDWWCVCGGGGGGGVGDEGGFKP